MYTPGQDPRTMTPAGVNAQAPTLQGNPPVHANVVSSPGRPLHLPAGAVMPPGSLQAFPQLPPTGGRFGASTGTSLNAGQ